MTGILDNATTANVITSGALASNVEAGNRFWLDQAAYATGLRWYRTGTLGTTKPLVLSLWDGLTQQRIGYCAVVPDSGSAGWQTFTFPQTIQLAIDRVYAVSGEWNAGATYNYFAAADQGTPPSPFYRDATRLGQATSYPAWPTPLAGNTNMIAVDVLVTIGTSGVVLPITPTQVTNDLTAWLADTSDNTHRAGDSVPGLPDTTKVAVDAIATDTTAIVADTAAIATEVDGLHTKIAADGVTWDAKLGPLQLYGGVTSLGISAGVEIVRTDVAGKASQSSLDGAAAEVSAIAASVALQLALNRNALVDFPSSPWVMTDETAFDTDIAYTEEADLYVVTFTDLGSNLVNTVVAGVDVSYRLAWWTPLVGAFAQQRRFIDTPSAHLWLDGTRLPGVLLHSPAGAAGTIQAWLYA